MNKKKGQLLDYTINFGIAGLQNASLLQHFYPIDLPSDWRLSFYSNEFRALLVSLADLDIKSALTPDTIDHFIELFTDMIEDARDTDCVLFFDLSELQGTESTADMLEIILNSKLMDSRYFNLVNLQTPFLGEELEKKLEKKLKEQVFSAAPVVAVNETEIPFKISQRRIHPSQDAEKYDWFCLINDENKIKAPELKTLIETIQRSALQEISQPNFMADKDAADENNINIVLIFSSAQYALENCRNAILLESMM